MDWIKKNKLTFLLIIILFLFLVRDYLPGFWFSRLGSEKRIGLEPAMETSIGGLEGPDLLRTQGLLPVPFSKSAPVEQEERLVIEESSMSLVVAGVRETVDKVVDKAKQLGGFMVSTSLTRPEEAPFATVVVRVPAENLQEALDHFRGLAIKVSSENILGTDVTAEYVDLEARLATLEKTKAKFEEILVKAVGVQDILQVQRELIRLQDEIDALKGRQKYLEQTAKLAKITVYLSTDEYALPYVPAKPFRPQLIFKLAVRSLVDALRSLATGIIWVGVYALIWGPALLIFILVKRWWQKKNS